MDNPKNIQIERYITYRMNPTEAREFEELLVKDKELNTNYQETLTARRLIMEAGRIDLKSTFESFDSELKPVSKEKNVLPLWIKRSLPIAALLVVFSEYTNLVFQ